MSTPYTIQSISNWFKAAVPAPTDRSRSVQRGVHIEEVSEWFLSVNEPVIARNLGAVASAYKVHYTVQKIASKEERIEHLDALCDQIVTAIGEAHMQGYDIVGALGEVDRSNWSKFLRDGTPKFDENGKIAKNPETYFKANLESYV